MLSRRFTLQVVQLSAMFAAALADSSDDESSSKMKGIGMPILFMVTLGLIGFTSRAPLIEAAMVAKSDLSKGLSFLVSAATIVMSIFFYFTPAYGYGLISTVLAYVNIVGMSRNEEFAMPNLAIHIIWFCILVGVPNGVSSGIINDVASTYCTNFYPSYTDVMCKSGWVVFVSILACVLIGMTLMSLLGLLGQIAAAPPQSRNHDSASVPLRSNEYAPPTSEYQKVTA